MQSRTAIAQSTEGLPLLDGNAINEECDIALIALLASLVVSLQQGVEADFVEGNTQAAEDHL